MKQSGLEALFLKLWRFLAPEGLPDPVAEHSPFEGRRFRFDFAWPDRRVAVELQGAVWARGRHTRGKGYEADCEKLNLAQADGWTVFYLTGGMLDREPTRWILTVADAVRNGRQEKHNEQNKAPH